MGGEFLGVDWGCGAWVIGFGYGDFCTFRVWWVV